MGMSRASDSRKIVKAAKRANRQPADHLVIAGWWAVLATALIPFLVIAPVVLGGIAAGKGRETTGASIMVVALMVFAVRLAVYTG